MAPVAPPPERSETGRILAAMALLVGAGTAQELMHLAGREKLGLFVVVPTVMVVLWLWRPPAVAVGGILLVLALEALLPGLALVRIAKPLTDPVTSDQRARIEAECDGLISLWGH